MQTLSNKSETPVLGGISHNSSKTVLNTLEPMKIKSRDTSKQAITVVQMTLNHKCSFTHESS